MNQTSWRYLGQNSWRSTLSRRLGMNLSCILSLVLAISGWLMATPPTWAAAIESATNPQTNSQTHPQTHPQTLVNADSAKASRAKVETETADSIKANSGRADRTKSDIQQSDVKQADVKQADIKQADTEQADVEQAELAKAMLQQAYDNRYSWDSIFPGYEAEVAVKYQENYIQGTVALLPDLSVKTRDIGDDRINQLIASQLQMMATQLDWLPFSEVHGKNQFKLTQAATAELAEVEESGEGTAVRFQVTGDRQAQPKSVRITQLNRTVDQIDVEIRAIDFQDLPTGYIPIHWQVTLRQDGKVLERDDVKDTFTKVGKYYVMTKREIRTEATQDPEKKLLPDYSLRFNNIRFLSYSGAQFN